MIHTSRFLETVEQIQQLQADYKKKIDGIITSVDYSDTYKQGATKKLSKEYETLVSKLKEEGKEALESMADREQKRIDLTDTKVIDTLRAIQLCKGSIPDFEIVRNAIRPFIGQQETLNLIKNYCEANEVSTEAMNGYTYNVKATYNALYASLCDLTRTPSGTFSDNAKMLLNDIQRANEEPAEAAVELSEPTTVFL